MNPRVRHTVALVALAGAVAGALVLLASPHAFLLGYLVAAVTMSAIPAGALAVLMMTYLVRGPWTEGLHAPLTATALTVPLAGLFLLPVLAGSHWLYPWVAHAPGEPGSMRAVYLSPGFFAARTVAYFAAWTLLAGWARRAWGNPREMTRCASAGLIVYALTASLAGVDWLQSLTPDFHSSMYGFLFLTFQVLAGYAFALVLGLRVPGAQTDHYGPILLAAVLLWAYNHVMHYVIMWAGNIPEEAAWYVRRGAGAWGVTLWGLVLLQLILPFCAMLFERVRNGRRPLLAIAAATLALRLVEAAILALPGSGAGFWRTGFALVGALLALGGVWWLGFESIWRQVQGSAHDMQRLAATGAPARSQARPHPS